VTTHLSLSSWTDQREVVLISQQAQTTCRR
jgi:hypothetical protein